MAAKNTPKTAPAPVEPAPPAQPDLGTCDNHPESPAAMVTDGVKFQVTRLCKRCVAAWDAARSGRRRG